MSRPLASCQHHPLPRTSSDPGLLRAQPGNGPPAYKWFIRGWTPGKQVTWACESCNLLFGRGIRSKLSGTCSLCLPKYILSGGEGTWQAEGQRGGQGGEEEREARAGYPRLPHLGGTGAEALGPQGDRSSRRAHSTSWADMQSREIGFGSSFPPSLGLSFLICEIGTTLNLLGAEPSAGPGDPKSRKDRL